MTAEMTSTIGKLSQALCGKRPSIYIAGTAAKGGEIFAERVRQIQGQGSARSRRPQSLDRCTDPDRRAEEARLHARQGSAEWLIVPASAGRLLGGCAFAIATMAPSWAPSRNSSPLIEDRCKIVVAPYMPTPWKTSRRSSLALAVRHSDRVSG
jgi:hypothetical protein